MFEGKFTARMARCGYPSARKVIVELVVNSARTTKRFEASDQNRPYPDTIGLIERLHHRFLDVINDELVRCGERDISGVQSLLLFNVGDRELQMGELHSRDLYLGTNASYIVRKLVEGGYIHCERGRTDRRSSSDSGCVAATKTFWILKVRSSFCHPPTV